MDMREGPQHSSVICHTISTPGSGLLTYDDPDGLSRVAVIALAQDTRGYLWIGTEGGPVRFDGMQWTAPTSLWALRTFDTWAFDTLEPHALWVGTNGEGLWLMDTQPVPYRRIRTLTAADGLADNDVHVLCRDAGQALWVGTHHGLAVVEDRRLTACWTAQDGIPEAGVCALCGDPAGGMWAGSLHGLLLFDRRSLRAHLGCRDGLPDGAVYALCLDAQGRLWAGTRRGIVILRDGRVEETITEGLPALEIRALCLDRAGRVWAGTAKGLALIDEGRVRTCWTRAQHLPSSSVWSLLCDRENRLWVGTEKGLAMLPQQTMPVQTVPLDEELECSAYAFASDQRQQTWIGTAHGLVRVAPDGRTQTTPAALPAVLDEAGVWVAHRDGTGRLWVAGRYGGLYALDPETGQMLAHIEGADAVRCLATDPDGRLWIGTLGAGLACLDTEHGVFLHRLTVARGLPCDHVSSLCLDRSGRLWAGTLGGGVACLDRRQGTVVRTIGSAEGLPHLAVSGLVLGSGNTLWGTTQGGGLFRLDLATGRVDGVWGVADGLPSEMLFSCTMDAEGALWMGTARGLTRFQPATGETVTLGRPHGLPGEHCQKGALLLDEQGRLWVGTLDGVAVVSVRDVPRAIPACAVHLTRVQALGREREVVAGLEIEDSDYDLVIEYGAVAFEAAAQVLYRTQLVGLDGAWSLPHPHRFARYTNLRPGDYTFRVSARNYGGEWSAPVEWPFRVVRSRQAHELELARQRAEAAEAAVRVRNEVLRTVAHDLRTPLTAIMGHADLLQSRLQRAELPPPESLRRHASAIYDGARRMASMTDEITDALLLQMGRSLALQIAPLDLGALVQQVAQALEAVTGPRIALDLDARSNPMVEGDRSRLERVMQNLIGNAVKYSPAAAQVKVAVYEPHGQEDMVAITVKDSGVGIPAGELPHIFTPYYRASTAQGVPGTGLGLASAKAIVEQHGGQITLESQVGRGTTVTVHLPRHARGCADQVPERRAG